MGQDWNRYKRHDLYRKAFDEELAELPPIAEIPWVNLDEFDIDPEVVALVPPEIMSKYLVVPINRAGTTLIIAAVLPLRMAAINDLEFRTGLRVEIVRSTAEDIKRTIARVVG